MFDGGEGSGEDGVGEMGGEDGRGVGVGGGLVLEGRTEVLLGEVSAEDGFLFLQQSLGGGGSQIKTRFDASLAVSLTYSGFAFISVSRSMKGKQSR